WVRAKVADAAVNRMALLVGNIYRLSFGLNFFWMEFRKFNKGDRNPRQLTPAARASSGTPHSRIETRVRIQLREGFVLAHTASNNSRGPALSNFSALDDDCR